MRILQYIPDFDLGGVQKAGVVLAKYFRRQGHDVCVIGRRVGPRQVELRASGVEALAAADRNERAAAIDGFAPDIVHIHGEGYDDPFVTEAMKLAEGRTVVLTPVFGRAPDDHGVLERVTTCCVGLYTHQRLCRWLRLTPRAALARGIAFAELTPYEDPAKSSPVGDRLPPRQAGELTFGRVGRAHFGKWHPRTADMVSSVLENVPEASWLSVGWPVEMQRTEMQARWGRRFVNFDETADFEFLHSVFGRLDLHFFASRYGECFSSTICEAASVGTPTISALHPFNDAGEVEQVIDGLTGWLARDTTEFVARTVELLREPATLAGARATTRHYARTNWHVDVVGRRVLRIYEAARNKSWESLAGEADFSRAAEFTSRYRHGLVRAMAPMPFGSLAFSLYHSDRLWRGARSIRLALRRWRRPAV